LVRFVTGVAGQTSGMICARDLRECLWLGAVGFVTTRTDDRGVGQFRRDGGRIVGVFALRSVAGFAWDVGVASELLHIDDFGVAAFADLMTGECRRARRDFADGIAAVVSVLAKALGDDGGAEQHEHSQKNDDDDRETDEMFGVLEHDCFPGPEFGTDSSPKRHCDLHCDLGYRGWGRGDDEWNHRRA
jgi:hypothetical protein